MTATVDSHLYVASFPDALHCVICGLPEVNLRHNARPVRLNRRTRRLQYTDDQPVRTSTLRQSPGEGGAAPGDGSG